MSSLITTAHSPIASEHQAIAALRKSQQASLETLRKTLGDTLYETGKMPPELVNIVVEFLKNQNLLYFGVQEWSKKGIQAKDNFDPTVWQNLVNCLERNRLFSKLSTDLNSAPILIYVPQFCTFQNKGRVRSINFQNLSDYFTPQKRPIETEIRNTLNQTLKIKYGRFDGPIKYDELSPHFLLISSQTSYFSSDPDTDPGTDPGTGSECANLQDLFIGIMAQSALGETIRNEEVVTTTIYEDFEHGNSNITVLIEQNLAENVIKFTLGYQDGIGTWNKMFRCQRFFITDLLA